MWKKWNIFGFHEADLYNMIVTTLATILEQGQQQGVLANSCQRGQ
jgi:hypothetical protein